STHRPKSFMSIDESEASVDFGSQGSRDCSLARMRRGGGSSQFPKARQEFPKVWAPSRRK
ncbi:MAG: hypothetical protein ABIR73_17095, partial [Usitatibacter sp.]